METQSPETLQIGGMSQEGLGGEGAPLTAAAGSRVRTGCGLRRGRGAAARPGGGRQSQGQRREEKLECQMWRDTQAGAPGSDGGPAGSSFRPRRGSGSQQSGPRQETCLPCAPQTHAPPAATLRVPPAPADP